MVVSSKTWAGSATKMWTRCPRQAWPRGSLIIKHYRVQVGNHQRGYQNPCIRHALKKELLLLEQINQWLGVLRNTYGVEVINLPNHRIHSHMHNWLGMIPGETKLTFSNSRRQLTSNARESKEVTSFIQTYTSETELEGIVYKVSNTSWMFNTSHGEGSSVADGLNNNSSRFPFKRNSIVKWTRW